MKEKATERPWRVVDRRRAALKNIVIMSGRDNIVADMNDVHQRDPQANYNSIRDADKANAVDARGLANAELIVRAVNDRDEHLSTIRFLMTQVEHLAESLWSPEDAAEWLKKCDAYNAGQRALKAAQTEE